jgi:hypothetical protein
MGNRTLSLNEILGIVSETASPSTGYPPPEQVGPLRWYDRPMRCLHESEFSSRRIMCHSPTYAKLNGVPMCEMHALKTMNLLLVEKGAE